MLCSADKEVKAKHCCGPHGEPEGDLRVPMMEAALWTPNHQTSTAPNFQLLPPLNHLKVILARAGRSLAPAQPFWHPTTSRVTRMLTVSSGTLFGIQVPHLPPDFHGLLVVGAEEVIGAVMLHRLAAILAHVENCTGKAKTVKTRSVHQHSSAAQHPWMTLSSYGPRKSILIAAKGSGTFLGVQGGEPGVQQKGQEDVNIEPVIFL